MTHNVLHSDPAIATANGIEIIYDMFGDLSAPPLLLIMGLNSQMIIWDEEFCVRLATKGYLVIRFDNRDVGLSTKFNEAGVPNIHALMQAQAQGETVQIPYTLRDMADDAVGLLDALEIGSAHVIGASMGGMIGQMMAIHHPERLHTLTSMMSTAGDPVLPPLNQEAVSILFTPVPTDRTEFIESFVQAWRVFNGPEFPVDEVRALECAEQSFKRGVHPAGAARQLAAVIASGNWKEALKSVTVPTLVIHGDADPLVPVKCGIDIADTIPGAKLLIIKGMGHALPPSVWPQVIDAIALHAVDNK
ncbi:MAG: alpha/beta fold hydrolase [Deltaproteobacteria bacterium]|nr:alpha/beta fold hydrolase [Deltaproteobacteria bacterium]